MAAQRSLEAGPEMAQRTPGSCHSAAATTPYTTQQIISRMDAAYDWTGPDDPDNPRNFSAFERLGSIAVLSALAFVSAFGGSIYAPAQEAVMDQYHLSGEVVAVLPLSLYNLGMALGPLVGAPLSEAYGRKAVFVATTPVFGLFMLGSSFAKDMTSLAVCRFFAGVFASPNISNASASILDYTPSQHRGSSLGVYYSLPSLAAGFAPLVGGFLVQNASWRWTMWVPVIVAVVFYVPLLFMRETYKKIILRRRAVRSGLADTGSQRTSASRQIRYFFKVLISRPLHMLFTEPIVTLVSLYNGLVFGILFTFVISIPWIFEHYYGLGHAGQSLTYLGIALGSLLACCPFVAIDRLYYQPRLLEWQRSRSEPLPPEHRLIAAMVGSFLQPASLLIAGWTAQYRIHWIVPVLFQGLTMLSSMLVYASACLFMLDTYGPLYGASASSAMMFCRYTFSFAFPMFALRMFQDLGAGWATTVLAGCSACLAPMPWCFWVFGERIRAKTLYETSS